VPYQRFHEVNTRAQALEAEKAQLQAQIEGHKQSVAQHLANQASKLSAERQLHVALARAGVAEGYADLLAERYQTLGKDAPPVGDWIASQKTAIPGVFAQNATPAPVAPAPVPTPPAAPPPARGNPDAGANGAAAHPNAQDPPLTMELIEAMDRKTYDRRRSEIKAFLLEQRTSRR
jgi:hypothetical protein